MNARKFPLLLLLAGGVAATVADAAPAAEIPPIERQIPPAGIVIPQTDRARLEQRLEELRARQGSLKDAALLADVEIYLKAVEFALLHREFYAVKEIERADAALDQAEARLDALQAGKHPWTAATGLVVRGYTSNIDGSPQPYGLVIPEDLDLTRPAPLYVWLHGRGDKTTDLHFIHQRQTQTGQIAPPGAIVLHPFGRQCVGFKSAGEIDVLEAIAHVRSQHNIDEDRIVLMGFSMGGAGAWHLGAHYADRWAAVSPGAGFAETARYQRLAKSDYPPAHEQKLWGLYDVPCYVRNLFNVPVVAYSGELDRQIQAARVMEEAYRDEGRELTHLIGPGMEHKYHPETLAEILTRMDAAVNKGRGAAPEKVFLQTRTLRYSRMHWVEALSLGEHWLDSRIDAELEGGSVSAATKNVISFRIFTSGLQSPVTRAVIDSQPIDIRPAKTGELVFDRLEGKWRQTPLDAPWSPAPLQKSPRRQGPLDDAFFDSFVVVTPTGRCAGESVQQWVDFELNHLRDRWRAVFRGELPETADSEITRDELADKNIVLFGDPASNRWIAELLKGDRAIALPLAWTAESIELGGRTYAADRHVPLLIFPSPLNPDRYLVLNSGPTFREAHDRTNSLQNPKLPDWAIIDITHPPDAAAPGRIVAADFFDESWRVKGETR